MAEQHLGTAARAPVRRTLVAVRAYDDQIEAVPLGVLGKRCSRIVAVDHVERQPLAAGFVEPPRQPGPLRLGRTGNLGGDLGMDRTAHGDEDVDLTIETARQGDRGP